MQWTPDQIRMLADSMERRLGRAEVRITSGTLRVVIEALRFYAVEGFAERRDGYRVDVWDLRSGTIAETVGSMTILGAAEAVFAAACAARPGSHVMLSHGARIMREQRPGSAHAEDAS